jgi:four helix bundle protein
MKNLEDNLIIKKSMAFAVRSVKLARYLREEYREYDLASQILRSGTSIGANAREALRGLSRPDFRAKMGIALKEAEESEYWIELLYKCEYLLEKEYISLMNDCVELCKMLMAIVKSTSNPHPQH